MRNEVSISNAWVKRCLVEGVGAALDIGDVEQADRLLASVETSPPGEVTPYLEGHRARLRARIEALNGATQRVDDLFRHAEHVFGESALPFHLAVTLQEHAEWLAAQERPHDAEALVDRARTTFAELGAAPWLERASASAAPAQLS
jgi:hypothetical protein